MFINIGVSWADSGWQLLSSCAKAEYSQIGPRQWNGLVIILCETYSTMFGGVKYLTKDMKKYLNCNTGRETHFIS